MIRKAHHTSMGLLGATWMLAGTPPPESLDPFRVAALEQHARQSLQALDPDLDARPVRSGAEADGTTWLRVDQTWRGLRVWGAQALVGMSGPGSLQTLAASWESSIRATETFTWTPNQALEEAIRDLDLAPGALPLAAPAVERVLFPTRHTGGPRYLPGPEAGVFRMDPALSVLTDPPEEPHVPAYAVALAYRDPRQGILSRKVVVDGRTGMILHKEPLFQTLGDAVPVVGRGFHVGTVALSGLRRPDGRTALLDGTRPRRAHPQQDALLGSGLTPVNGVFSRWGTERIQAHTSATNVFGDGASFNYLGPFTQDLVFSPNGQTAAVDVAFGLQTVWDLLKQVVQREGTDGQGTGLMAEAHVYLNAMSPYANAFWDPQRRVLAFGDGGSGLYPFTSLDVVAHEAGHALMSDTANFVYQDESGAMNEANSDIVATATELYALGGGTGSIVPPAPTSFPWIMGWRLYPPNPGRTAGVRSLMRPSQFSNPDAWFDGMTILGVHSGSGPVARWFYFLSQGSDPNHPDRRSAFLPEGMAGIGPDKAFRIWIKALTTHVANPNATFLEMRTATEAAATALYGTGGELTAVRNAWAAVNVGPPAGQSTAPRLRIDPGPWPAGLTPGEAFSTRSRDLFVGIGQAAPLPKALAENFPTPPTFRWKSSFAAIDPTRLTIRPSIFNLVGWSTSFNVDAAGTPHTAMAMLNPVVLDLDGDGEVDAADAAVMAIYAHRGYLPSEVYSPDQLRSFYPPPVAIYRWNRALEALGKTEATP